MSLVIKIRKLDNIKVAHKLELEPVLEELQVKNAIDLGMGSLGVQTVSFVASTNHEKLRQLNKEFLKDRPRKRLHMTDQMEYEPSNDEVRSDIPHRPPPYMMHKPPPTMMDTTPPKFPPNIMAPPPTNKPGSDIPPACTYSLSQIST